MAPTLSRKQREIAEREKLVLRVAADLLRERGYLGLTMDRIAEATEYSKGTIYQHFRNKEEVVAALAIESGEHRIALFERAATFRGSPRERCYAVGIAFDLFVALRPDHHVLESLVAPPSLREKVNETLVERLEWCERRCMEVVVGLMHDAIERGELTLPEGVNPEQVTLGLWAMAVGTHEIIACEKNLADKGIADPRAALHGNYHALLDGWGWKPLSREHDYATTLERVYTELFPDERARAFGD